MQFHHAYFAAEPGSSVMADNARPVWFWHPIPPD